ncbi:MAG: sensor histidine kinase [Longimicrobiales bacterium]
MPKLFRNSIARQAALFTGAALLLGGIGAGQDMFSSMGENRYTLSHALIMETPFWLLWVPLFPLVSWLARRIRVRGHLVSGIGLHLLAGLLISTLHYTITMIVMGLIGHHNWTQPDHTFWNHYFPDMRYQLSTDMGGYLVVLSVVLGMQYYRKYRERELLASKLAAQLSQARLQTLRMQLNPHFLFNAMNSIAMLVRRNDNANAVRMLAGLSDLLRYVLEDSREEEVPLRDELQFIERYLDIERVRFQDRLRVKIDVADETSDAFVPNLLLQPLVENALRHGLARKVNPGTIEIAARKLGDRLILQVRDDGPGISDLNGGGVGLANTRKRLEQSYGSEQSFELRNGPLGGAVATVSLPFHTAPLLVAADTSAA